MDSYIADRLRALEKSPPLFGSRSRASAELEVVLLAALSEARGLHTVADDLLARAWSMVEDSTEVGGNRWRLISQELDRLVFWSVTLEFGDEGLGWPTLAADLEWYLATFPKGRFSRPAKDLLRGVREIDRDVSTTQIERTDVEYLIHKLPVQAGAQLMEPGEPNVLATACSFSPAHELFEIGPRAVPLLVGALTDSRPTRTIGWRRSRVFSHYVLKVRDVALLVLYRIARARRTGMPTKWRVPLSDEDATRARQALVVWLQHR